jgi:hypothetical protein
MLNARGVSRAGAKARVLHPKQVTTLKDHVLSHKFVQCLVLHCVFLGKSAFSGLALVSSASPIRPSAPLAGPTSPRWSKSIQF